MTRERETRARPQALGLRRCVGADAPAVHALIHRTIGACYAGVYPPRAIAFFKRFHSPDSIARRIETATVLGVERQGRLVATGALLEAEITGVFVDPDDQGRGLGDLVMGALEREAAARGCAAVRLSVSLPSRGFYEHRGYRMLEERSLDVGEGQRLDYWEAEKSLAGMTP